ncbi:MAG: signal peptidase II [Candidatus Dojkabacteria bacterium]
MKKTKSKHKPKKLVTLLTGLFIGIDQLSKLVVVNSTLPYEVNDGIALSIFRGSNGLSFALALLGIALAVYLFLHTKPERYVELVGFAAIFAGGFGNIIDRVLYEGVVDFIQVLSFPTFNVADALVSFGIVVVIVFAFNERA